MPVVVVVGAGAVGSLLGGRLHAAGTPVLLVGRPAHVAAIRAHGLRIDGVDAQTVPLPAETRIPPGTDAAGVLVTVKTFDLSTAAEEIARSLRPTPVLLLENGLGIEPVAIERLGAGGWADPARSVVRAINSVPATLVGPGVVRAAGSGELIVPVPSGAAADAIRRLTDLLRSARLPVRAVREFDREVWRKALVNAAINPVTAIHGVANGRLADGPLHDEAVGLLHEAIRAAGSAGFDFEFAEAEDDLARVVRATSENRSSMLQDVDRGRPTEIDAISGAIVRVAADHGVDLPRTRSVIERLRRSAATRPRSAQSS